MQTGIELIAAERQEQIEKHGRTIGYDANANQSFQLAAAASILCLPEELYGCNEVEDVIEDWCPNDWDKAQWEKMLRKGYEDRLKIAGALIAAELDRIQAA